MKNSARSATHNDLISQGYVPSLVLKGIDIGNLAALCSYPAFLRLASVPPGAFERWSPHAALRAAAHAARRVPAYRKFLANSRWRDDPRLPVKERVAGFPVMDKLTYVAPYSTEERCINGKIPMAGTEIDESSGSSGTPFNWVRGKSELRHLHRALAHYARLCFDEEVMTINAFSMGAWATGVNVGEGLRKIGAVKSIGPDVDKIYSTLRFFGPRYPYLITGYPPFLKHLIDQCEARGLDWKEFRVFGIVGGEGMSEALRFHLERRFIAVYSCYGASDVDLGVAAEVPLSVWIRKHASANAAFAEALFGKDSRLPMLFQYNPLDYYIETNGQNELIVTVNRLNLLSPRIRYNIHDSGGVLGFEHIMSVARDFGIDPRRECPLSGQPFFQLPFLYVFGRSDDTISYMGANLYPEDVEHAILAQPNSASRFGAYCLELVEVGIGEYRPCVHVELLNGRTDDLLLIRRLREQVLLHLLTTNRDFQAAAKEDASATELIVRLHGAGQGPFADNESRIKRRYILKSSAPAANSVLASSTS